MQHLWGSSYVTVAPHTRGAGAPRPSALQVLPAVCCADDAPRGHALVPPPGGAARLGALRRGGGHVVRGLRVGRAAQVRMNGSIRDDRAVSLPLACHRPFL